MRLITPRLIPREYVSDDLDALCAHQTDPRAREHYGPDEGLPEQIPGLLRTFLSWSAEKPRRNWQLGIALRSGSRPLVESCGLRRRAMEAGHMDLGVDLAPDQWGRGYGSEATTALLDFGFCCLGAVAVHGQTVSANARVAGLLARLGFSRVGTSQGAEWMQVHGWRYDEWELSAEAWQAAHPAVVRAATAPAR